MPPYPSSDPLDLPEPAARRLLHRRTITLSGYHRDDGLFDIEGELLDHKSQPWRSQEQGEQPAAQPVHHMRVRLTIDAGYAVHGAAAALPAIPFPECRATLPPLAGLVGAQVSRGWRKAVEAALGGEAGCTHVRELLMAMGTAAYQTLVGEQRRAAVAVLPSPSSPPPAPVQPMPHWGRCIGWRYGGEVLRRLAPGYVHTPGDGGEPTR